MSRPIIAWFIKSTRYPNKWTKCRFVARIFSITDVSLFKECSHLAKMATGTSVNGLWALRCDEWQFFQLPFPSFSLCLWIIPPSLPLLILYPYAWWRHQMETFSALLAICAGSPVNSPHKGQWRGASMFSFICIWINGWLINRGAGELRRHRAH